MMNQKKGFTLVELLAVIVILAIILVIAVPKVMSVIEDSKKATLESTAKMIASAAEKALVQNTVLGKEEKITCDSVAKINKLDYESCSVEFDGNVAMVTIKGAGKFAGLNVCNGTKTVSSSTNDECAGTSSNPNSLSSLATTSTLVTGINECVSKGKICTNGANGTDAIAFAIKVNETEVYDFYVISDNGTEITLIMPENLGENVAWGSYEEGPTVALDTLKTRTSNWSNIPERNYTITDGTGQYSYNFQTAMRARLITRDEAFNTLGCTNNVATKISGCPSFMYNGLTEYGNMRGYWTLDTGEDPIIKASYIGYFTGNYDRTAGGIRPVITLEK